jgi:hypothetical protein
MADEISLKSVLADLEKASGADRGLDAAVAIAVGYIKEYAERNGEHGHIRGYDGPSGRVPYSAPWWPGRNPWPPVGLNDVAIRNEVPEWTASLDATIALVERVLPGWWWIAGLCGLTGRASIGPDYNGPHRERLLREFPIEKFDAGFDVDLAPGDGIHRACYALLTAMFRALVAKMEGVE